MLFRSPALKILSAVLICNFAIGLYCYVTTCISSDYFGVVRRFDTLTRVVCLLKNEHVDNRNIDVPDVMEEAIESAGASQDPFTEYLPPSDLKALDDQTAGEFGGCGISVMLKNGKLTVIKVFPDTPAERSGVRKGDVIVAVDDKTIPDNDETLGGELLRGEPGTSVKVTLLRDGGETVVTIRREVIALSSIEDVHVIGGTTIGYIAVTEFQEHTGEDFSRELQKLLSVQGITGLIMDLRGNPGGLLTRAVDVCSQFLAEGDVVVTTECNVPQRKVTYCANRVYPPVPSSVRLVILIDKGSASAAEITASCLKDHGRAVLVGETSFGKGSVQRVFDFPHGDGMKVTVAKYYTKKHQEIHQVGITPDVVVPMDEDMYKKWSMCENADERDRMDPQLQAALEYLKKEMK